MKPLRGLLDKIKPNFSKGGTLEKWFPLFDAAENLLYSSDKRTFGSLHIRDSSDIQKVMVVVWLATFPAMFYGMYNIGFQALSGIEAMGGTIPEGDWHAIFINILCIKTSI